MPRSEQIINAQKIVFLMTISDSTSSCCVNFRCLDAFCHKVEKIWLYIPNQNSLPVWQNHSSLSLLHLFLNFCCIWVRLSDGSFLWQWVYDVFRLTMLSGNAALVLFSKVLLINYRWFLNFCNLWFAEKFSSFKSQLKCLRHSSTFLHLLWKCDFEIMYLMI